MLAFAKSLKTKLKVEISFIKYVGQKFNFDATKNPTCSFHTKIAQKTEKSSNNYNLNLFKFLFYKFLLLFVE